MGPMPKPKKRKQGGEEQEAEAAASSEAPRPTVRVDSLRPGARAGGLRGESFWKLLETEAVDDAVGHWEDGRAQRLDDSSDSNHPSAQSGQGGEPQGSRASGPGNAEGSRASGPGNAEGSRASGPRRLDYWLVVSNKGGFATSGVKGSIRVEDWVGTPALVQGMSELEEGDLEAILELQEPDGDAMFVSSQLEWDLAVIGRRPWCSKVPMGYILILEQSAEQIILITPRVYIQ